MIVVGAGSTTREQLGRSVSALEAVQARLLGLVLNKLPRKGPDAYSYYHAGYAPQPPRGAAKAIGKAAAKSASGDDDHENLDPATVWGVAAQRD